MITLPLLLLLTLGTQQASAGLDPITRAVQRAHSSTVALNSIDSYLVSVEDALIDAEMALEGYPPPPKRDLWTEQKIAERKAAGKPYGLLFFYNVSLRVRLTLRLGEWQAAESTHPSTARSCTTAYRVQPRRPCER
jgi:hypothetical protein